MSDDQATRLRELVEAYASSPGELPVATLEAPSTPTGRVSFRPRSVETKAAATAPFGGGSSAETIDVKPEAARQEVQQAVRQEGRPPPVHLARAIAVVSGKGGVGKSNMSVNLAVALVQRGLNVCVLDADLGLANLDVLCNISPDRTLQHVIAGRCRLSDAIVPAPGGFGLIPGASGVAGMAMIGANQRRLVFEQLAALERAADIIIIDCSAGLALNVLAFAAAASLALVTTTPEPTAVTDAYGLVKNLVRVRPGADVSLLVNMAATPSEGVRVHERMEHVARSFLGSSLGFAGSVPYDPAVVRGVRERVPFAVSSPTCPAARALAQIAPALVGLDDDFGVPPAGGFFARLSGLFRP